MGQPKRSTVYFDSDLHKALKLKSAETGESTSAIVNQALRLILLEDADDLQAFEDRKNEPSMNFESYVRKLKKDGKL